MRDAFFFFAKIAIKIYWRLFRPHTQGARAILYHNHQVLLVKHYGSKHWFLPGGGVKKGETFKEAAQREVWEETNIRIRKLKYFHTYQNLDEGKFDVIKIFVAEIDEILRFHKNNEVKEMKMFDFNNLPFTTSPSTAKRINEYFKKEVPADEW